MEEMEEETEALTRKLAFFLDRMAEDLNLDCRGGLKFTDCKNEGTTEVAKKMKQKYVFQIVRVLTDVSN
jgi:hypothetical protein